MSEFNDRFAVVTGASSGIGLKLTETLLGHGATVLAMARREGPPESLHAHSGKRLHWLAGDVTRERDLDALASRAASIGPVDYLVPNAGIAQLADGLDSLRFLPIYQGAASQLAAIEEQEANVFERAALEPARLLAGYFLERFGLAVNHWSRLREFAADRRAAQLAGAPAMASALLRSAAAGAPIRAFLEHCLLAPARAPDNLVDAIHVYLGQSGLEAPDPGAEGLQVHPQDTHPPLGMRCKALGESFERTWAGTAGRAVPTRPPSQALSVWFGAPLALSRALSADLLGKTCENPHARN
ncbi:TPA: SDR family NAD(P)-dependent oxidoreductase [Pseudomonas aeruginosa]|nr:SDR family NAD(P)-dependent oxidoreductase [Pseudomonas aeruginosa]